MKAAVYERFEGPISIREVADPIPFSTAVVLKVAASGLCLSDWHGWMGHDPDIVLPHVPGHELAGVIVEVGSGVRKWRKGQRVTVPFVGGCGHCEYCLSGNQQVCDRQFQPGFTAWGSFAEYVRIDYADENLVEIPEDLNFIEAASLGCRFITAFRAVADQAKVRDGQFLAVHGCGGVGLSAVQIGAALGARVIAVDINEEKCRLAASLGAEWVLNAKEVNVPETIRELTTGGVHASMDALGHSETCLNSIRSLRKRGKHIQVGLMTGAHENPSIPLSGVIANELEIIGSHGMQAHRYGAMFSFIRSKGIDLHRMISNTIGLGEVPEKLRLLPEDPTAGITVLDLGLVHKS